VVNAPNNVKDWITQKWCIFPLLVFVIPLIVRVIPEILMGPYIVGFDTLGVYVPVTLLWLHNGVNLGSILSTAPLFYTIFFSIVAAGGSPVWALKIIPPLLLGFLGLAMYVYARKGLEWSPVKSVVPALLGTVYFVALRISWDMLRTELGFIFFFVFLTLLSIKKTNSLKNYLMLSLVMVAVVLSHQLVAVIMLGVVLSTILFRLIRRNFNQLTKLSVASLPSVLFFVIVNLSYVTNSGFIDYSTNIGSPLASWTGFTSYQYMLISEVGFFLYCFLFLLPLVLISLKGFRNLQLGSWLIFSFILLLIPIVSVSPFRWVLMLIYPLAFYTTDALSWFKKVKWKHCGLIMQRIAIWYLVLSVTILSVGYVFMTPERPFVYFNSQAVNYFSYQIPSSMLQNTVSITDCRDTTNALQWFKDNLNDSALLLTHTAFYGWALLTIDNEQISYYEFNDPVNAATTVAQGGRTQIFLIWWINGEGWYGEPTLNSSFHEVYHSGKIAIYNYEINQQV
jgi:hypothetical protein